MRWSRILGFLGLLGTMLLVVFLSMRNSTRSSLDPATAGSLGLSAGMPGLGDPPPPEAARDPRAAKRYLEQQDCLGACAMEGRTCESTAEDQAGEARCRAADEQCQARCREGTPP